MLFFPFQDRDFQVPAGHFPVSSSFGSLQQNQQNFWRCFMVAETSKILGPLYLMSWCELLWFLLWSGPVAQLWL